MRAELPGSLFPVPIKLKPAGGTAVTIELLDFQSSLLSSEFISKVIRKHFYPLLHPQFINSILKYVYKKGVEFFVNGEKVELKDFDSPEISKTLRVTIGKKGKRLVGFGYLAKSKQELPAELSGIGISTYGKVIKRGWDWLGILPKSTFQIYGMVEIPALSEILTTNKNDFLKDAASLKKYYRYRKAIQEAILPIFTELGEERMSFETDLKRLRPLEREIEETLRHLLKDFPELTPLVGVIRKTTKTGFVSAIETPQVEIIQEGLEKIEEGDEKKESLKEKTEKISEPGRKEAKKKKVPRLTIGFEKDSFQSNLARMVKNVIWINTFHPAYQKARKEGLEEYHILLCVAWVLSKFIEEARSPQDFVSQFLASWGSEGKSALQIFKKTEQKSA